MSLPAFSALVLVDVEGASHFENEPDTTPVIFGGTAGTCTGDSDSTCNSCEGITIPPQTCNLERIHQNLYLRIHFQISGINSSGAPYIANEQGTILSNLLKGSSVGANSTTYVEILWSNLCSQMSENANNTCDTANESYTLRVGIDANGDSTVDSGEYGNLQVKVSGPQNTTTSVNPNSTDDCENGTNVGGICYVSIFPGDEKVYIDEIARSNDNQHFPTFESLNFTHLRVFISEVGFDDITPNSSYEDLEIRIGEQADDYSLSNDKIEDLTNGILYYFKFAVVDQAKNIAFMASDNNITAECTGTPSDDSCPYMATPDKVYGLLREDFNCFIASATYGSSLHPKLNTFRHFRNRFLLTNSFGRKLNAFYYQYGPYAARGIAQSEALRFGSRIVLWPLWLMAELSLKFGLAMGFVLWMLALALLVVLVFITVKTWITKAQSTNSRMRNS